MWQQEAYMAASQEPIMFLRSGKASLTVEKFNNFWKGGPSLGHYIVELVKYYCEVEKSKKISGISVESTIASLYFIVLSGCYDVTDSEFQGCLEEARTRWDTHRQNHESFNPLIDEIMTTALNISTNPDDHIHLVFSHCLLLCPRIETFNEISYTNYLGQQFKVSTPQDIMNYGAKGISYLSQNPRFCLLEKSEFILTYYFLNSYLHGLGYLPVSILDLFHRKIQEIIISLRAGDCKHAQRSLLPLLHMLKCFLTKLPIISYDSMDALIIDLDILRRWPLPYGLAANKLLELVIKELKSPGSAMRYKLREEFPLIDSHTQIFENSDFLQNQTQKLVAFLILDSSETLEAGYFYRISSFNKKHKKEKIMEMIEKIVSDYSLSLSSVYAHVNRCLVVLFAFSLYTEITITDLSHIAGLSSESIFGLYKRVLQMVEKIENEEMDKARSLQEWFILELFEESKSLKSDRANPLTEPLFVYLSDSEIYFPKLPTHNITVLDLTQVDSGSQTIVEHEFIVNESGLSVTEEPIIDILRQSLMAKSVSRAIPIKVILTGSDAITHKFLRNYVKALVNSSKSFADLDIRFYVVPTFQVANTLGMYLASIDPWYARHVYLPFYSRPWLPRLDTKIDLKQINKKHQGTYESLMRALALDPLENGGLNEKSLPIVFSEIMMQDYLSEADHMININVYKLKCYKTESAANPDEVIPMALYLDIGANVAVKQLQETNLSFKGKSFLDIVDNKAFRFRSVSLRMEMNQMDLLGNTCGIDEVAVKNVYNLTLANVPRENDRGMHAIPQAEWLELSFIEREASDQEANLLRSIKNKKIKEPQSQVNIAINSLYSNLHVNSGKISATDEGMMDVIVDGVLYGPFKQIIFEPWIAEDSLQCFLPLRTFLDTES